ncbi:hypothetical protein [Streptomyces pseudovenezuelae]|uniref:Uncharacterized protein n=1 Tax=Streptomyces pseudovenezuelae TaxID=67350 RepID=A0ABZ1X0D0_9ACTN|nr:hypothetical protein [Streptomyces pseudovenezuelae]
MADVADPADAPPVPPVPTPDEEGAPPAPDDIDIDGAGTPDAEADALDPDPGPDAAFERRKEQVEREEDDRGYDDLRRVHQLVNNNFYGVVDASGAAFGFGTLSSPGLAPGTIEPEERDRALRFYLPPRPCFDEAFGHLTEAALVVLTGPDNCGRGAGSLALLRRILGDGAKLRSLSPANALAELAASRDLKPGQGYVILDYVGELRPESVQAYEIGRLSQELRRKGSYLVITAGESARRRLALRDHCVPWQAPDPVELFDHCRGKLPAADLAPDTEKELLERVGEQRRPADVVAAAVALSREGPATALDTLRDRRRELVQQWFAERPSADDLLALAALAFLEGIPERTFEKESAALVAHVRNWERSGETPVAEPDGTAGAPLTAPVAGQSRARWRARAVGLVTTEHRPGPSRDAGRSERRLVFTSPRVRELVIAELHDLYGYELWYPLALLRTVPHSARHLGSLWADVLHSSNRSRAVGALCRTLVQLRDDPSVTGAVRELGEAMRDAMTPQQWAALCRHLSIALNHPDYAIPGTHQLAQVLVGSLRGRTPAPSRRSLASLISTPPFPSARGGRSK